MPSGWARKANIYGIDVPERGWKMMKIGSCRSTTATSPGFYIISNDAPPPSSTLVRRRWGGEVAAKPDISLETIPAAARPGGGCHSSSVARRR